MSEERKEETTLEQRIMKSNLSDDDKIELIQRLKNSFPFHWDKPIEIPCTPKQPDRIIITPNTPYRETTYPSIPLSEFWYIATC